MSKKVVSIDDILAENLLELTISGKTYQVHDFNVMEFLRLIKAVDSENIEEQHQIFQDQLAKACNCDSSEFENLSLRAILLAIKVIRDWIIGETEEAMGVDDANP